MSVQLHLGRLGGRRGDGRRQGGIASPGNDGCGCIEGGGVEGGGGVEMTATPRSRAASRRRRRRAAAYQDSTTSGGGTCIGGGVGASEAAARRRLGQRWMYTMTGIS